MLFLKDTVRASFVRPCLLQDGDDMEEADLSVVMSSVYYKSQYIVYVLQIFVVCVDVRRRRINHCIIHVSVLAVSNSYIRTGRSLQ